MSPQRPSKPRRRQSRPAPAKRGSSREPRKLALVESGALRLGAVAAALLSILTAVFFATDRLSFLHHRGATELNATLSDITVSPPLSLEQFAMRTQLSPASFTTAPPRVRAAADAPMVVYAAQTTGVTSTASLRVADASPATLLTTVLHVGQTPSNVATSATNTTAPTGTTDTTDTTDTTNTSGTTNTTGTSSQTQTSAGSRSLSIARFLTGAISKSPATPQTKKQLLPFVPAGVLFPSGPREPQHFDLKIGCALGQVTGEFNSGAACPEAPNGRTSGETKHGSISEGEAEALLTIFHHTQTNGTHQPVGVIVNFNVTLSGPVGQRAVVKWTLWSLHGNPPAPWLHLRPVIKLAGQSTSDHGAPQFWIPLPDGRGPFYVELSVWHEHGGRIAYMDSPQFN
jgi:hypothetical protein